MKKQILMIIAVLFSIPLTGLSIDIYVPSLPEVGHYFLVNQSMVQLSITLYMLGFGSIQFVIGVLLDRYGRKKLLIAALSLYILATIAILFVNSITLLLIARLIQGLCVGVVSVATRSIISDNFSGNELYKMFNYMTLAWSIGPIVAPAIGGYLATFYGWRAGFGFLLIYAVIAVILSVLYIPETTFKRPKFEISTIIKQYWDILGSPKFWSMILCVGGIYGMLILFNVMGPFLFQNTFHYTPSQFGNTALLMGVAWFTGNMLNRLLIRIDITHKIKYSLWGVFGLASCSLISSLLIPSVSQILISMILLISFAGFCFTNFFAQVSTLFMKSSGIANGLIGGFCVLLAAILGTGTGVVIHKISCVSLALGEWGLAVFCIFVFCGSAVLSVIKNK
jgi:MFS transporter, DHA1 family, multidrug resistance protein